MSGTNSWILGRDGAYLIDPGPAIAEHVEAVLAEAEGRGGFAAIVLTHSHPDHSQATAAIRERTGAPVASSAPDADIRLGDGATIGPLTAVATPGHAADHLSFVAGRVCFSGDAVLGEGSVFVASYPGALAAYLAGLARLRELDLELIAPGHGPLVTDPAARIDTYIEHRLERERQIAEALAEGLREEELLERVWPNLSPALAPIAQATLQAHLGKLADEGRLPG
ncbi:MAG TPA: MBL fold metallo-hydrolase [Solirubrobacteraceae bacterium]|nr:MBL fold metallo-hydrolase [Solirubrobacteraceae bacterium]